jgi:hypothetical protein
VHGCQAQAGVFLGTEALGEATLFPNGDFEAGPFAGSWQQFSTWRESPIDGDADPFVSIFDALPIEAGGDHLAVFSLGQAGLFTTPPDVEIGRLVQDIVIPFDTESLRFFLLIEEDFFTFVGDPLHANDIFEVSIDGNVLRSFTQADADDYPGSSFSRIDIDVRGFADGGRHTIRFDSVSEVIEIGSFPFSFESWVAFAIDRVQLVASGAGCEAGLIDFDFLTNGKAVTPLDFLGASIVGTGNHNYGAAIFDSGSQGPNAGGPDPDLLVGSGGILILQENGQQTVPGIYDIPDDAQLGGSFFVNFDEPGEVQSVDLIDIDNPQQHVTAMLTDLQGRQRAYLVPDGWTGDVRHGAPGIGTLDLLTSEDQVGFASTATLLFEDAGFDGQLVIALQIVMSGSGAIDDLNFHVPRRRVALR